MTLKVPQLDDRSFHDLVAEAQRIVSERCPDWSDRSAGDPGTTLLELYAFMTEVMLYRINRLPEKAYIEFLRLMGVKLRPPSAARVELTFSRAEGNQGTVEIPRGTRVTLARAGEGQEPPIFTTAKAAALDDQSPTVTVLAHHCVQVEAEELGVASGSAGQSVQLSRAPVIAPTGDPLDLVIGIETSETLDERTPSIQHDGITYRIWRETEHFTRDEDDDCLYIADRATGTITFAPAVRTADANTGNGLIRHPEALAAVPTARSRIRAWYRSGGGAGGNVAANTLTVLKDPIAGVRVTNPEAAVGGAEAESLANALQRGPHELHSLNRAITARDYEAVALREGSVGRAHAVARAERWQFAAPGTVQLLLVPGLDAGQELPYSREQLENAQTRAALERVREAIDTRKPLGTECVIDWYRYKPISVHARLMLHAEEDARSVRSRVSQRLNEMINPLGRQALRRRLHASDVYHTALAEPGVLYADRVHFSVEQAPETDAHTVVVDPFHPQCWYAGSGDRVFRSMDNGGGWEMLVRFADESILSLSCSGDRAGLLAVLSSATRDNDSDGVSRIRLSDDCGQNWGDPFELDFEVNDLAWLERGGAPVLLMATDKGLYQLPPDSGPVPVPVDPNNHGLAFYAVTTASSPRIGVQVAVAARKSKGVYLCPDEQLESFHHIGLDGRDVRVLAAQSIGPRAFLWAGLAAVGGAEGDGCLRWELRRDTSTGNGWESFAQGWKGGSCRALVTHAERVYAATFHNGIVTVDSTGRTPTWEVPSIDCGLPLRDADRLLHKINDVAVAPPRGAETDTIPMLLGASPYGVFRSTDQAKRFESVSARTFSEEVTIGEGFLFCSGEHGVEAVHDAPR